MPKFGLIGYPIAHSQSPQLFAQAYHNRWSYDLIEDPSWQGAWERFVSSYDAVNVTAPYKTEAYKAADTVSEACMTIGAANILVKTSRGVEAHNSDYLAARELISEHILGDGVVLVVGAGGAGRAAAAAARGLGLDTIVCNRTREGAIRPLEEIPLLAPVSDMVIYTLPCAIPQMEGIECGCLLEANYRDPQLETCPGIGIYIHGREWLRAQARLGYRLMTGEEPDL